jgi:hypothetical protein
LDGISIVPGQGVGVCGLKFCVIVCGLHRSGTSAVTRLINLLGADIADDLLANSLDNSRGYWESHAVVDVHNRLLNAVASAHDDPYDPMPLRIDWLATPAARDAKRQLDRAIKNEFADSRLFVVKDPRIARLLPLWIELLRDLNIAPIVVIPFRNPLEVAASLAHRDQVSLPKTLLLYLHTYLGAERASRTLPRIFVRYDHLLCDWRPFARRLAQIHGAGFSPPSRGVAIEIDEFLTTDLYHHRFSREQLARQHEVPRAIVEMFDRMDAAAKTGDEDALRSSFDRLQATADAAAQLYCGFVASELGDLQQKLMKVRASFEASTSWRITAPLRWIKLRALPKPPRASGHRARARLWGKSRAD